tara:strand:- start:480 stop:932 length:453 start_codon:yes stop_codon:yes gene_type:complete
MEEITYFGKQIKTGFDTKISPHTFLSLLELFPEKKKSESMSISELDKIYYPDTRKCYSLGTLLSYEQSARKLKLQKTMPVEIPFHSFPSKIKYIAEWKHNTYTYDISKSATIVLESIENLVTLGKFNRVYLKGTDKNTENLIDTFLNSQI